jgi:hypothetical protein
MHATQGRSHFLEDETMTEFFNGDHFADDELVAARTSGCLQPWRRDANGAQWFRETPSIRAIATEPKIAGVDDDDFDEAVDADDAFRAESDRLFAAKRADLIARGVLFEDGVDIRGWGADWSPVNDGGE